ncbi:MAG: hypothetical protein ABI992_04100 [Chthoniobacterales bacterium]
MHLNPALTLRPRIVTRSVTRTTAVRSSTSASQANAEIHAYIAARDLALVEAERNPSALTLNRAFLANQLVANCLQPVRSPYQAQSLGENEAARERQRCENAAGRISVLRTGGGSFLANAAAA